MRERTADDALGRSHPCYKEISFETAQPTPLARLLTFSTYQPLLRPRIRGTKIGAMGKIRIIDVPPGEAPEQVRGAWVGLVLPLVHTGRRSVQSVGVVTGPKHWWMRLLWLALGKCQTEIGYVVDAPAAIAILAERHPDAAAWWSTNAPRFLRPGHTFVFRAQACEEID
jgi:hypothetical protein